MTANGRFLRHRFSPKSKSVATVISLPKRNHVAKETVSAAWQTRTRQRSERICKPNDAPKTKPRPCVKPMLADAMRRQFTNHWQSACKPRLQSAQANHKECYPETAGYQQLQVGDRSHSTSKIRILALPTEEFAQVIRRNECADE